MDFSRPFHYITNFSVYQVGEEGSGNVWCVSANATEDQIDAAVRWLEISANNYQLTDDFKATLESGIQADLDDNELVGIKVMSIWQQGTDKDVI